MIVFEALTEPNRDPARPWLTLLDDECAPQLLQTDPPILVVWSSIWRKRPDARIRFDLTSAGGGTNLCWTLTVDEPVPDDALTGHFRKRLNQLINGQLRSTLGQ